MHDSVPRVAGKFPGTSCPHVFGSKKIKTSNKHKLHAPGPTYIINITYRTQTRTNNDRKLAQTIKMQDLQNCAQTHDQHASIDK